MVSVTMTTVAKEAGPRRPSTSRNEGWREVHPSSGCSFLEFSCQAVEYGSPLGSERLGAIFGKKSPGLKRPKQKTVARFSDSYCIFLILKNPRSAQIEIYDVRTTRLAFLQGVTQIQQID